MSEKLHYVTDDRDKPLKEQRSLVIFVGGNGDWYVQVGDHEGRAIEGVRLCTSGGASSHCPGLTTAIADAYRAMHAAKTGEAWKPRRTIQDLEAEIAAWRSKFPNLVCDDFGDIVEAESS